MKTLDCRSREGINIGLIDGVIAQCRILREHFAENPPTENEIEALKDINQDEDVRYIANFFKNEDLVNYCKSVNIDFIENTD